MTYSLGTVRVEAEVDLDDVIRDLSRGDREDIYDRLRDEFGEVNETVEFPLTGASGYYDEELRKVLIEIWQNRNYLTTGQRARLTNLSKESFF